MSCLGSELTSLIIKWASEWLTRRPVLIDRPLCKRQNSRQKFRLFFTLLGPCPCIITKFNTRWMPCKSASEICWLRFVPLKFRCCGSQIS
jgi:hypothetical protein